MDHLDTEGLGMRKLAGTILVVVIGLITFGCGNHQDEDWIRVDEADLTAGERERFQQAEGAARLLFERLMGRLQEAVAAGGVPGAIGVCRDEAPRFANEVAEETGLRIGRTSHRLRNPANAPPDWIRDATAESPRVFRGPEGALRVTLPIRAKAMCLQCHGAEGQIEPAVRAAIDASYPDDRARGFSEGDLRGMFWIEVPGGG
jgi:hypothetical protein